jgi:hypothetical protein
MSAPFLSPLHAGRLAGLGAGVFSVTAAAGTNYFWPELSSVPLVITIVTSRLLATQSSVAPVADPS